MLSIEWSNVMSEGGNEMVCSVTYDQLRRQTTMDWMTHSRSLCLGTKGLYPWNLPLWDWKSLKTVIFRASRGVLF